MELKIKNENLPVFKDAIKLVSSIIDEANFKALKDGIHLRQPDRASACLLDFHASNSFFEEYKTDNDETLGVNLTDFNQRFRNFSNSVTIDNKTKRQISIREISEGRKRRVGLPLLELEDTNLPVEQFKYEMEFILETNIFKTIIRDVELSTDAITFELNNGKLKIHSGGSAIEEGDAELELTESPIFKIFKKSDKKIVSTYPLQYIKKFTEGPISEVMKMSLTGSGQPIKIEQTGDKIKLEMYLAPRVMEEGEDVEADSEKVKEPEGEEDEVYDTATEGGD